jgi:hypothetical protein
MKSAPNGKTKRGVKALGLAAAVIAAGLIAFPSPVQAHNDHGKKRGHRKQVTRHHAPRHGHYQRVPRRFVAKHRRAYRQHYRGRVYHRSHRHYHEVYRFPVYVSGRVSYQPYAYCGDQVYYERPAPLPRLAFGLSFSEPGGFYFSGYYQD